MQIGGEQWTQDTQERHNALLDELAAKVSEFSNSDTWKSYLTVMAKFHDYSSNNTLLITTQYPEARKVAGFKAWQALGRHVKKGEKAIWIIAPIVSKQRAPKLSLQEKTPPEGEDSTRTIRGFRYVPVFDISQTEGADLPEICSRLSGDHVSEHFEALVGVANSISFTVELHELADGSNGDCSHYLKLIRVDGRHSMEQQIKTLAHELAHALLHESFADRPLAELEAESVAYVVCNHLSIASDAYSLGYVATWAGGGERAAGLIKACSGRIQHAASQILRSFELQEAALGVAA